MTIFLTHTEIYPGVPLKILQNPTFPAFFLKWSFWGIFWGICLVFCHKTFFHSINIFIKLKISKICSTFIRDASLLCFFHWKKSRGYYTPVFIYDKKIHLGYHKLTNIDHYCPLFFTFSYLVYLRQFL